MKTLVLAVVMTLALVASATAQAPTLEERVAALEEQVADMEEAVVFVDACLVRAVAVSQSGTRLYRTTQDRQLRVYFVVVEKSCVRGIRDNYRWPWWKVR